MIQHLDAAIAQSRVRWAWFDRYVRWHATHTVHCRTVWISAALVIGFLVPLLWFWITGHETAISHWICHLLVDRPSG